jgi:hypothetical protein
MSKLDWCTPRGCITKAYNCFKKSIDKIDADDSEELSEEFDSLLSTLDNYNIIDEDAIDDLIEYLKKIEADHKIFKRVNQYLGLVSV